MSGGGAGKTERAFISGRSDALKLGGYGGTVHLEAVRGGIRIRYLRGRADRTQYTMPGTDTGVRKEALAAAHELLGAPEPKEGQPKGRGPSCVTVGKVLCNLFRHACPEAPPGAYREWGRGEIARHLAALSPEIRDDCALSAHYIVRIAQASRVLLDHPRFRDDQPISDLEFADINGFVKDIVRKGNTKSTAGSYLKVLRTAVGFFKTTRPKEWKGNDDPFDGVWPLLKISDAPRGEFPQESLIAISKAARSLGLWRLELVILLISLTGRRVGEMGADQGGNYDYVIRYPLTGNDLRCAPDGSMTITFRAKTAKGEAYQRPDLVVPVPPALEATLLPLISENSNPLGPEFPIIFSPRDPRKAITHKGLNDDLKRAWEAAFPGKARPRYRSFHAMSKTAITEAAHHLGIEKVADLCGKSPRTIYERYREKREESLAEVTNHLAQNHLAHLVGEPD